MKMFQSQSQASSSVLGAYIADALSMPTHWYYDLRSLHRDYGEIGDFVTPNPEHPDSIFYRSRIPSLPPQFDIFGQERVAWGRENIHYHRQLEAGENTLNFKLGLALMACLERQLDYSRIDYAKAYCQFMLKPNEHRDTYIEECHRNFFVSLSRGVEIEEAGRPDIHIGGLTHVPILFAAYSSDLDQLRQIIRSHVALTHPDDRVIEAALCLGEILFDLGAGMDLENSLSQRAMSFFSLRKARKYAPRPDVDILKSRYGLACYIDQAFPAALYLAWKYREHFEEGVLANANLGGDNCHRGAVVGSILGLINSEVVSKSRWRTGLLEGERIEASMAAIFDLRSKGVGQ